MRGISTAQCVNGNKRIGILIVGFTTELKIKIQHMDIHTIAIISIVTCIACFFIIFIDILTHPRPMTVMNLVWPITALYAGPVAVLLYYKAGRQKRADKAEHHPGATMESMPRPERPFWQSVVIGTLHCGAGCTIGDLISEILLLFIPVVVFGSKVYGGWIVNFAFAFVIGIVFQYVAIKPMRNITVKEGIIAALKADTLSLTCWQVGMYGWMAISFFLIFHHVIETTNPVFWLMMQIAMLAGFITAFPINWFLIKAGIKEAM